MSNKKNNDKVVSEEVEEVQEDEEEEYQVWFNEGDDGDRCFDTFIEMKEYFDICVGDMKKYGYITIDTPVKKPNKISCYKFNTYGSCEDDLVEDLDWENTNYCS
jgi:hypothetical protein